MFVIILALFLFSVFLVIAITVTIMTFLSIVSMPLFCFSFFTSVFFTFFLKRKTKLYWYCPLIYSLLALSLLGMLDSNGLAFAGCSGLLPSLFGILIGNWLHWVRFH